MYTTTTLPLFLTARHLRMWAALPLISYVSCTQYSLHITLVDQCLKLYREGINEVCKVEQNLATGTDAQGEPITDPMKDMMPCLFNRKIR